MSTLDKIKKPNDIKNIPPEEYEALADDIRMFLLDHISQTGGHLASNLGAVELTMALHLLMDFPKDKLIWDVGHQAYTHKILTGRQKEFEGLRTYGGMSGFPKRCESECDVFETGHSSTSISAALGFAAARQLNGGSEKIVAVIGDGSFSGGLAYEALNNMAQLKGSMVVILNDNDMSIDQNVGGMSKYLNKIRVGQAYNDLKAGVESTLLNIPVKGEQIAKKVKRSKDSIKQLLVPGMFFEDMGISYVGPIDGHNIQVMLQTIKAAFELNRPIIIHVKTKKGKGYRYAEKYPTHFHGVEPFNLENGKALKKRDKMTYTGVFGRKLALLGSEYDNIVAITAAMSNGTGLEKFREEYPNRFFDVGIAEAHAVTFAAGLAAAGMIPVVAVYSSFLQRAYDQILHDVCNQNLHVIFAVDRSGLVGADGSTHQGIFDISYLSHIPNMTIVAPKNRYELSRMMEFAVSHNGPIAIKYARGDAFYGLKEHQSPIVHGKSETIYEGDEIAIIAVGNMVEEAVLTYDKLVEAGYHPTLVNARFVKPIDYEMIENLISGHRIICTMEENVTMGGFGEAVGSFLQEKRAGVKLLNVSVPDTFVEHGSVPQLRKALRIDGVSVAERIVEELNA